MVLIMGLAACLVAIPLSNLCANALARFVAELMNFNPPEVEYSLLPLVLQFGVGLLVPLAAAAGPVMSGARVSPARVLSEYGLQQTWRGTRLVDSILARIPKSPRDIYLAVRNPFRKRGRLALSLATLTFAGAVFMAVVSLRASLNNTLGEMLDFWGYDAWLVLDRHYPNSRLEYEALSTPGVSQAEAWGFTTARNVRADGTESADLYLMAPPAGSNMLNPPIIAGRALTAEDHKAVLITPGLLAKDPGLHLGGDIVIKIEGREETYADDG